MLFYWNIFIRRELWCSKQKFLKKWSLTKVVKLLDYEHERGNNKKLILFIIKPILLFFKKFNNSQKMRLNNRFYFIIKKIECSQKRKKKIFQKKVKSIHYISNLHVHYDPSLWILLTSLTIFLKSFLSFSKVYFFSNWISFLRLMNYASIPANFLLFYYDSLICSIS